jgi:hypothetical protein
MKIHVTEQIPALARPATRISHVNRAFSAALGTFLDEEKGASYAALYEKYINVAPRFPPRSSDCDRWEDVDETNREFRVMLDRGTLRFGYIDGPTNPSAPYVYPDGGKLIGFDHDLAEILTAKIAARFGRPLRAEWVAVTIAGDDQADKLRTLFDGLMDGSYDIALAGQMMLPEQYLGGLAIEWTAPTAMLFTAITWTGKGDDVLDVPRLKALHGGDLAAFQAYAVEESRRVPAELRIFSVVNPGPSPSAATDLVYAVNHAGGQSVWHPGEVADSGTVMQGHTDHFTVGDSLASGAQTKSDTFRGLYLNIPATDELWPLAGFTPCRTPEGQRQFAVYAEHSDSKKPMVIDQSQADPKQRGWNVRVFNRIEVQQGTSIRYEPNTGIVTLGPGRYHIVTSSIVTYDDLAPQGHVTVSPAPFAGYSRLRDAGKPACLNEEAIAIGTMSTANMGVSLIDTWLDVKDEARLVLEHQVGNNVDHLYMQGIWEQSSWHVFARIAVERM